jgi:hypothetical protein
MPTSLEDMMSAGFTVTNRKATVAVFAVRMPVEDASEPVVVAGVDAVFGAVVDGAFVLGAVAPGAGGVPVWAKLAPPKEHNMAAVRTILFIWLLHS